MNGQVGVVDSANKIGGIVGLANLLKVARHDLTGYLAGLMPAHSISHHKDRWSDEIVVLIIGADLAWMGSCSPAKFGHLITEPQ